MRITDKTNGIYLAAVLCLGSCLPASGAQFGFNTLIQIGSTAAGAGNWELGIGNNSGGAPTSTQNLSPDWLNGNSRKFQVSYTNASNSVELRMFSNDGSTSVFTTYTPAGGPAGANAQWTLPATSFFASAAGALSYNQINVSGLSLTDFSNNALNVISGMSTTTLTANNPLLIFGSTVRQSQDVVFLSDASGNWRLQGFVTMTFSGSPATNQLQFGVSGTANASPTPEPGTWAMMLTGLTAIGVGSKRFAKLQA